MTFLLFEHWSIINRIVFLLLLPEASAEAKTKARVFFPPICFQHQLQSSSTIVFTISVHLPGKHTAAQGLDVVGKDIGAHLNATAWCPV